MVSRMGYKLKFVTIGYLEWRKGQDILVDAIEQLPSEISALTEFVIVGQNTTYLGQQLVERTNGIPNVKMMGKVSRDEIHKMLANTDVMICPSREDPMPTVCAEAMMHSVFCIVSDSIGTAKYIKDGYNGLIFKSENSLELMNKIIWCIKHRDDLKGLGEKAHQIYEDIFSTKAFEKNLLKYVEDMIGKAEN